MDLYEIAGLRVIEFAGDGPLLGSERDASDVMSEAFSADAIVVVIPANRLAPEFFRLRSGLAGGFFQKLQNYHCRLVIMGDVSAEIAASTALRDFVRETNKVGNHLFVADRPALELALLRPSLPRGAIAAKGQP